MLEQEYTDLGFEHPIKPEEFPDDFYTGYDIEQEIKREFDF